MSTPVTFMDFLLNPRLVFTSITLGKGSKVMSTPANVKSSAEAARLAKSTVKSLRSTFSIEAPFETLALKSQGCAWIVFCGTIHIICLYFRSVAVNEITIDVADSEILDNVHRVRAGQGCVWSEKFFDTNLVVAGILVGAITGMFSDESIAGDTVGVFGESPMFVDAEEVGNVLALARGVDNGLGADRILDVSVCIVATFESRVNWSFLKEVFDTPMLVDIN